MGPLFLLAVLLSCGRCSSSANHSSSKARQATPPGYQLSYPRTNAIGVGAACVQAQGKLWVVGGSGDTTAGAAAQQNALVYGDTRTYDIASRGEQALTLTRPACFGMNAHRFHKCGLCLRHCLMERKRPTTHSTPTMVISTCLEGPMGVVPLPTISRGTL